MKLLPRPEAITGEVFCGQHRMRSGLRSDAWCLKPANHEGSCRFGVLPYEEKSDQWKGQEVNSIVIEENFMAPEWNPGPNIKVEAKLRPEDYFKDNQIWGIDLGTPGGDYTVRSDDER